MAGGSLELRSNWRVYLDEFAVATHAIATEVPATHLSAISRTTARAAALRLGAHRAAAHREVTAGAVHPSKSAGQDGCSDVPGLVERLALHNEAAALTLFELKYHHANEQLYRLLLPAAAPTGTQSAEGLAQRGVGPEDARGEALDGVSS
jgi:hypothetical protein